MIVCPRCSYENEDSATNCTRCRINLRWALENLNETAQHDLEPVEGPPPEIKAGNRVARGFLVIGLLLAIPGSGFLALLMFLHFALSPSYARSGGYLVAAGFWLVVTLVCIPAAIVVLLRRRPKPDLLPGLRILALIAVTGGLLFGLMRLALVILPERTGRSLVIQYKLGERDFRSAKLEQAELGGADLHEANLSSAELRQADLSWSQLYRTDLSRADLRGADLSGANLYQANLSGADLSQANLTEAQVHWANLSSADLSGADLTGANLFRTSLRQANLRGATVTSEQLDRAGSLEGTILPNGSVHR